MSFLEGEEKMYGMKVMLIEEQKKLQLFYQIVRERLQIAPEGTLRIAKSRGRIQFYHVKPDKNPKCGIFIKNEQREIAKQLAQKSYDKKILKLSEKRLAQVERLLQNYEDDEIEVIFQNECQIRQNLINPIEPIWEQQLEIWENKGYEGKEFREEEVLILTEKRERVRSKSEKILADYFYRNNIPYKYEKPLMLKGIGTIYPDFTFLSRKTRKEIYWEHLGRMDDPNYAKSAIKKIQMYENNDIFVGERLILTYETAATVLNTRDIERKVEKYLLI